MRLSIIWPPSTIQETKWNDWKNFALEYGLDNGLNIEEAESFSDMIYYFLGAGPAVPLDNPYFKIQKIQFDIIPVIREIKIQFPDDEKEQVRTLFFYIFIMYKDKIYEYAKRSERLSFRVTQKQMADFKSVPGKSLTDKLQTLLEEYYKI